MTREALFAEYPDGDALVSAIEQLRERGYAKLDAHTPYPSEEVTEALGMKRSRLPWVVAAVGFSAAAFAYFLQWYLVAYLYPLNVGGRPAHMPLPFMIISFEMGVLFAAFAAFFGVIVKARLLRLYDPVFDVEGIETASVDRHWLRIDGDDALFHPRGSRKDLEPTAPLRVVLLPEERR